MNCCLAPSSDETALTEEAITKIKERQREGCAFDFQVCGSRIFCGCPPIRIHGATQDLISRFTLDSATEFLFASKSTAMSAASSGTEGSRVFICFLPTASSKIGVKKSSTTLIASLVLLPVNSCHGHASPNLVRCEMTICADAKARAKDSALLSSAADEE